MTPQEQFKSRVLELVDELRYCPGKDSQYIDSVLFELHSAALADDKARKEVLEELANKCEGKADAEQDVLLEEWRAGKAAGIRLAIEALGLGDG